MSVEARPPGGSTSATPFHNHWRQITPLGHTLEVLANSAIRLLCPVRVWEETLAEKVGLVGRR